MLERVDRPVKATSATVSGESSVRRTGVLSESVREAAVVLEGGETPGTESTVVDISSGEIHSRGVLADQIEAWLADDGG